MWKAISRQWFLLALVVCLALGFGLPDLIRPLAQIGLLRSMITGSVLFLMGLTLDARSIGRAVRRPMPALLGIGFNTLLIPLLALPALWLFSTPLGGGLIVGSLVPCTLASAAVWTRKAGGDDGVAMVVSVVTNLSCFLVAPLGLWLILGQVAEISAVDQITNLALWVVLPMIAGQWVRRLFLTEWAANHQTQLAALAQIGILVMVAFGSVASADHIADRPGDGVTSGVALEILAVGTMAIGIHCMALAIGVAAARALGASAAEQIAVGLAGSQKTLMVGLQIALDCGVSVLPMIIYHVGQLMIDTLVVQRWAERQKAAAVAPGQQLEPEKRLP